MTAPRKPGGTALLILDMVSEFRFEEWRPTLRAARRIAPRIALLKRRARAARIPVFYVNDAPEDWDCDKAGLVTRACLSTARGADVVRQVQPSPGDIFVFKPRHSGFYATPMTELLERRRVRRLLLAGLTSHQCVLFTAVDAYVRCATRWTRRRRCPPVCGLRPEARSFLPAAAAVARRPGAPPH